MHFWHRPSRFRLGLTCMLAAGMAVALLALAATAVAQVAGQTVGGPVYAVPAFRTHLAQDPDAWVDRPLRVQAIASVCTAWLEAARGRPCMHRGSALTDPGAPADAGALPVVIAPAPGGVSAAWPVGARAGRPAAAPATSAVGFRQCPPLAGTLYGVSTGVGRQGVPRARNHTGRVRPHG
jgi:hypothetical protein